MSKWAKRIRNLLRRTAERFARIAAHEASEGTSEQEPTDSPQSPHNAPFFGEIPRRINPKAWHIENIRWRALPGQIRRIPRRSSHRWWGLTRRKKIASASGTILTAGLITFGFFVWTGVSAALDARAAYRDLQEDLSHLTPVDLVQVNVYQSLEGSFEEAERSSKKARSRLRFLRAFTWLPVVGGRIDEVNILLDIGYHQGRAGKNLAVAYGSAISVPIEGLSADQIADQVAQILREESAQLKLVQQDLQTVTELREQLRTSQIAGRYGVLVDRYLPAIQTVAYLSANSPESIGHTYALSRELLSLQETASDPLDIVANPEQATAALENIEAQAAALEIALESVRQAMRVGGDEGSADLAAISDVLDTIGPGITVLRHVSSGTKSLVVLTNALETQGFLTAEFGAIAGAALDEAQKELTLARDQVGSLQSLLSVQGIDADAFLPSIGFGDSSSVSVSTTERVEIMLEEAISATDFLHSFLGFGDPRTYLILGQNQNEIRATGGFIGIAVEITLNEGELTELVFHDSTQVDHPPYGDNPAPPDGIYWYLWMEKLLFRDANWNPHFPASAAKVAELYEIGQGVRVDGIITASKNLSFDMVELFGDVTVPEIEGILTRSTAINFAEGITQHPCKPRHISARGKRCFDEDLFFSLKNRITASVSAGQRRDLVELIKNYLDQKNIMMHVFPPVADSLLWERGWNGAVPIVDHDYLMLVDSSLPGHSNAAVQRSWDYNVALDTDNPMSARLRVRYENEDTPDDKVCLQFDWNEYHCYWNYLRVYVSGMATGIQMPSLPLTPGSLKLIWGYPDPDSTSVINPSDIGPARLPELAGYLAVEPGSVTTVPIQYQLPTDLLRSTAENVYEYRLLIQKQPGMDNDLVSVQVQLPPWADVLETEPNFNSKIGQSLSFDFKLVQDTTVVVAFRLE